jgi:hypothetical protein
MNHRRQTDRSRHRPRMPEQPDSPAERTRRYRERLREAGASHANRPPCLLCGKPILLFRVDPNSTRGRSRTGMVLCATCWRKSDEGRAAERVRNRNRQPNRSITPAETSD